MTIARAGAAEGGFSEPKEIEKRLNAARAELAVLLPDADPELGEALQRIVASGEYHLSWIGVLASMRDQLAQAKEESSSWKAFPLPPPYSVRLLDEIRESLATHENSQLMRRTARRIDPCLSFVRSEDECFDEFVCFEKLRAAHGFFRDC